MVTGRGRNGDGTVTDDLNCMHLKYCSKISAALIREGLWQTFSLFFAFNTGILMQKNSKITFVSIYQLHKSEILSCKKKQKGVIF